MNHLSNHPLTLNLLALAEHKTELTLASVHLGDAVIVRDYYQEVMGAYELWGIALFDDLVSLSKEDFDAVNDPLLKAFSVLDEATVSLREGTR